jgi:ubiquinone/menaquinone biosynthesis C-methylase UbiE
LIGRAALSLLLLVSTASCEQRPRTDEQVPSKAFPTAHRPVAPIISSRYSTEDARDRLREADRVMREAGVKPGMTVADIGAGEGYYTVRLAARVGEEGRVVAQDVVPAVRDKLADRVTREALDNVSVKLGGPADPKLPPHSFDRVFMMHMYHEIGAPYEFLWRLRPSLAPHGRVVVVDADRPIMQHGTPAALLDCEFNAVGYRLVERRPMPEVEGYLALYEAVGARPEPEAIVPCTGLSNTKTP